MVRLFRVSVPVSILALLTSESLLFILSYTLACYVLIVNAELYLTESWGLIRIAIVGLAFHFNAYLADLYDRIRVRSNLTLICRMMFILGIAVVCESVVGYVQPDWALPTSVIVAGTFIALALLSTWRVIYSRALVSVLGSQKLLFLGDGPLIETITHRLQERPEIGLKSIGYLSEKQIEGSRLSCLGDTSDLHSVVHKSQPDRIILALTERRGAMPVNDLLDLRFAGYIIEEAATVYEEVFGRVCVDEIRPSHLVLSPLGPRRWTLRLQNLYSLAIAAVALIVTAPILLIAAIAIKVTSPGPIFYRQVRVGLHDVPFHIYKLRSMYIDAEARTGAVWATRNDPRITPVGRTLRKLRIDELPQLWNVLKGEMSVVGPRPERPEFVRALSREISFYPQRHCVKPGITGWAQINHQYGDSPEHAKVKLEYDLYYLKNLSPALDAYIMFHTAKTMLLSRGAQ